VASKPGLADPLEGVLGDEVVKGRQERFLEVAIGVRPRGQATFPRGDEPEPETKERIDDRIGDLFPGGARDRIAALQ
jgi:hypothetical protein